MPKRKDGFTDNAITLLKKRYLEPGETIDQLLDRVSGGNPRFRQLMAACDVMPNSPTLFNKGTGKSGTYSACFVLYVDDSMLDGSDSIMGTASKAAAVAKWGGGIGYYMGNLRPKNALIQSVHRKACGPVAVIRYYNELGKLITQGGKRHLAQMAILDSFHDDIAEFIHMKDADPQSLATFNISVSCGDKFMQESLISGTKEFEIWQDMAKSAWRTGDPGCFFIDNANRNNPTPHLGQLKSTNPCVSGETLILTDTGWHPIETLVDKDVNIWNGTQWSTVRPAITGRDQELLRVTYSDGMYVDCTLYHEFMTKDGTIVQAKDLTVDMPMERLETTPVVDIPGQSTTPADYSEYYVRGFYAGDGFWDTSKKHHSIIFYNPEKIAIGNELGRLGLVRLHGYDNNGTRRRSVVTTPMWNKNIVPCVDMPMCSRAQRLEWFAGLCDSDGSIVFTDSKKITYGYQISSIDHDFLRKVSLMLRTLGVPSVVRPMKKAENKKMPDHRGGMKYYDCQQSYRLQVPASGVISLHKMGLPVHRLRKEAQNPAYRSVRYPTIEKIEKLGTVERVYCFTEPIDHTGVFNGIIAKQCGEVPLYSGEACNLASIRLDNFVTVNRTIDWNRLQEVTEAAVEFLDHILDTNNFPHPEITERVYMTRKLGLGVMGWADLLGLMHIHYDTEEAVLLGDKTMKFINDIARDKSIQLAKSKTGPYPASDGDPCHHATRTCIAPTGSIYLIAGADSSGIEPHFALETIRTMGDGTQLHEKVHCIDESGGFVPKTANDIHWKWHVRHQAAFQKHTDLAVSKSINMPNSATVEDISSAYRMMHETGCKGGTVFRDGCREGGEQVLVSKDKAATAKKTSFVGNNGVGNRQKLPDERPSITHKFSVGGTEGYLTVGLYDDGRPGELFVVVAKEGSTVSGLLDSWATSVSLNLQYGITVDSLVRKFAGTRFEPSGFTGNTDIKMATSIVDYIVRWLDLKFGDKSMVQSKPAGTGMLCPECHAAAVYMSGCLTCSNACGYSKCG